MALEVFFTADDFGAGHDINQAVVCGHQKGALNAASLMMGQSATDDAAQLASENPGLQVGWHLHLCDSRPVTCAQWPWGGSPARAGWLIFFSRSARRLMEREVAAQWELFRATGLSCAFVNTHHHLHVHPTVHACLEEILGPRFEGWLRMGMPKPLGRDSAQTAGGRLTGWFYHRRRMQSSFRLSDTLWGIDRLFRMKAGEVRDALATLSDGLHEFMFHPRKLADDEDLNALLELKTVTG